MKMYFGVDYYPEHWDEARWPTDLQMMKQLNFNMVRVAEFAWSRLEPEEGKYDFSWLDRFLSLCESHDMKVMMGVPVRNIPAWLMHKDPALSIEDQKGMRESFGSRYTICLNHPMLKQLAFRLSKALAEHYKEHPLVVSWHLDNEYGDASTCYCDHCRGNFIRWLQDKYGTLEQLNKAWGMVFWSLELSEWEQVWVPKKGNHFSHNPGLLQDYRRFTSWTTESFVQEQADIFREMSPDRLITTNLQSMTRYHTDYHELGKHLDVVSTNYYPPFSYNSVDLDILRGIKRQNFWVVEQKSGAPGFQHNGFYTPAPGETRMYTYQSIAHGADAVLYFRWRPAYFGQEQLHLGILNYDGSTNRIYQEIGQVGQELKTVSAETEGTTVVNDVALLMSYEARWSLENFYPHPELKYKDFFLRFYKELEAQHITADIIHPKENLQQYKVVIVPLMYMMDAQIADNLARYVEQGGTLIYTFRSGAKDEYNRIMPTLIPPVLKETLGVEIEESIAMPPGSENELEMEDGTKYRVSIWMDLLRVNTARTLARYTQDWCKSTPAVTVNQYGTGKAYYIGTFPEDSFYKEMLAQIMQESGVHPILRAPREVQICKRTDGKKEILFVMNNSKSMQHVRLEQACEDILLSRRVEGLLEMEPYSVRILKIDY